MISLGIDWGRARVGLAVSDELGLMAHPFKTLPAAPLDELVGELCAAARERGAGEFVLGLPLNMDGTEGESARSVRKLSERLQAASGLPVVLWDERLTSWEADRRLREGPRGGGAKASGRRDRAAAALILQAYLDGRRRSD
jgi:putative holliday junction resolvase